MPRVLLPSDHRDWVVNFADAYRELDWDVTTGAFNFDLESCRPDVIHLNWPEELTGWRVPKASKIDDTIRRLDRWASRCRIILSVNNLYPHGQAHVAEWRRLYTACYERAEVIHHFSLASKEAVCREYPSIAERNHIVRVGFNYNLMLPSSSWDRDEIRRSMGIAPDQIVFLCFGSLRFWEEVCLIRDAFTRARIPGKRLFMAARYSEAGADWKLRLRRLRWERWQRRNNVLQITEYVPDEEVYRLFAAADAVVVVRNNSLSSGVPSLAMTFGRFVIAPDFGGIPEYISGADNLLYDQTSMQSLTTALENAVMIDREAVGLANRRIADGWNWKDIIRTCLDALPARPSASSS